MILAQKWKELEIATKGKESRSERGVYVYVCVVCGAGGDGVYIRVSMTRKGSPRGEGIQGKEEVGYMSGYTGHDREEVGYMSGHENKVLSKSRKGTSWRRKEAERRRGTHENNGQWHICMMVTLRNPL